LLAVIIPLIAFAVIYAGFIFLRDSDAPQWFIVIVAIVWGVGGVALLYWIFNGLVERLPDEWQARLQPFVFVGPALFILVAYLAWPTVKTFQISLYNRDGTQFIGFQNYLNLFEITRLPGQSFFQALSNDSFWQTVLNNLFWIIFGSTLSVITGLLIAVLADRSKFERTSKSLIFLPMAISFVGASIIWNLVYAVRPEGFNQIGLLNAIVTAFGGDPRAWIARPEIWPWNNLFLVFIVVWLQTGFAMVLFSAALKGIPGELMEASRVDGATEVQTFFRIMVPYIRGTIITVWTTIVIFTLKIFDVVWVMTGGNFKTDVIATKFYRDSFVAQDPGTGSAMAIILLIAVIPVMIYNLRQFREQEAF
jgi:alpha-glucoside transport system permease protein